MIGVITVISGYEHWLIWLSTDHNGADSFPLFSPQSYFSTLFHTFYSPNLSTLELYSLMFNLSYLLILLLFRYSSYFHIVLVIQFENLGWCTFVSGSMLMITGLVVGCMKCSVQWSRQLYQSLLHAGIRSPYSSSLQVAVNLELNSLRHQHHSIVSFLVQNLVISFNEASLLHRVVLVFK